MMNARADAAPVELGVLQGVLGYHMAQATVVSFELFDRHIGVPFDLRRVDFSLLMLLHANGAMVPKRLAQTLTLTSPNLTLVLDRLEQRGLLRRERNMKDKRSQNIVLTREGLSLAKASAAAAAVMERELLQRLSAAEHAMLIELLAKVARAPMAR